MRASVGGIISWMMARSGPSFGVAAANSARLSGAQSISSVFPRTLGWPGVRGNTDEMLWAPESLAEFAAATPKLGPLLAIIQEMIPPTLARIGEERLQ